ncbi:HD-GYP domain-containing protein, partial [Spirochaetota bacterium]
LIVLIMDKKENFQENVELGQIRIDVKKVKEGSSFSYPLLDEYDNLVLKAHTPMSKPMINHLISEGIFFLYYTTADNRVDINVGGVDTAKPIVKDEIADEFNGFAKDLFENIREVYDLSPNKGGVPRERIDESRTMVNKILNEIEDNKDGVFDPISKLKDLDEYNYKHSTNVSILSALLGSRLEYKKETRVSMGLGGLLHDIGKSGIPKKILDKKEALTAEEFKIYKQHPFLGHQILKENPQMIELEKEIVLLHHERADGKGYPHGFDSDYYLNKLPKEIRLISICNVYVSMVLTKSGLTPLNSRDALRKLLNMVYAPFKKNYYFLSVDFRDFIRALGFTVNKGDFFILPGDLVRLNTGEIAVIEEMNKLYPLNPKIRVLTNKSLQPLKRNVRVDMLKDYNSYIANLIDKKKKNTK